MNLNEIEPGSEIVIDDRWQQVGQYVGMALKVGAALLIIGLIWQNTLYLDRLDNVIAQTCGPIK